MKITADLTTEQGFPTAPKGGYRGHIETLKNQIKNAPQDSFRDMTPNDEANLASILRGGGSVMLAVTWKLDDAPSDFKGSIFDNVMVAGTSKAGNPISPFRVCDYINALGVEWTCLECNQTGYRQFVVQKGKHFCPNCAKAAKFDFDSASWQGRRAFLEVDIGVDQKGGERNEISSVRALVS